jgi:hypothetical protein
LHFALLVGQALKIALASPHHDPGGRLAGQIKRTLPTLTRVFAAIAVRATDTTPPASLDPLRMAGAHIAAAPLDNHNLLGRPRRGALAIGLETGADTMLMCDLDRALHWAERYPHELAQAAEFITRYDFTVLGRTPRAFASHPRIQRDTEAIANTVFAAVSGRAWDCLAAARGLSRRAAQAILAGCPDETVGTDLSWTLFLAREGGFSMGYLETEGLEFETPDRFGEEIAAAGGLERWLAQLDADPRQWAMRLDLARVEVEAAVPYTRGQLASSE